MNGIPSHISHASRFRVHIRTHIACEFHSHISSRFFSVSFFPLSSQRGNNYGAHLRTGLTPVSIPPPFVPRECSLTQAAVPTWRNTEKKEAERMNKRRGEREREKESLYKVQEGDRDRRIKSHRAQRPMRVEECPECH